MGETTSTLENDIESAVTEMFGKKLSTGGSLSILSENTERRLNQAPAETYMNVIDSPDPHIQNTNNDPSYDIGMSPHFPVKLLFILFSLG